MKFSSAASLLAVVLQSASCSAFMQGAPTLRRGSDSSPLVKNKLNAVSAPPEKKIASQHLMVMMAYQMLNSPHLYQR